MKGLIGKCIRCVRERAEITQQLMGSLPDFRVNPSRPFTHTGMDYAGPFDVRFDSFLFELVTDYTTPTFMAVFSRFVNPRGTPPHVYSDNRTNFAGARNELKKVVKALHSDVELKNHFATREIDWHFMPPNAPHFGRLVEATLNSRPIAPLHDNVEDFSYLTPGHFLIGAPIIGLPEVSQEFTPINRLTRWQQVQRTSEIFWRKWYSDYLHVLQKRYKWFSVKPNLKVGDMVFLRNENLPPCKWLLGRVTQCSVGRDNLICAVRVRTANSEFDRPLAKLCLLPINSNDK
ncbi:uncharacterized protein LOC127276779 [Leptopilina boulardi]|uniref:uncharacterized protein LOC127276779 n=1 Tax=Leptopilina boulardi TaxID=63433 RepID=UPI0021F562A7|nr:uncharacterized protein LOC127276779 [Leptopilina boulardi]